MVMIMDKVVIVSIKEMYIFVRNKNIRFIVNEQRYDFFEMSVLIYIEKV